MAQPLLKEQVRSNIWSIIMENFTPLSALAGGALIGLSASMMLLLSGRIAGISGIIGGLLGRPHDAPQHLAFLGGLLAGGLALLFAYPDAFTTALQRSPGAIVVAGLLVGFGTRLGNGCTSGHGVCGLSRLSPRSAVATGTFMASGVLAALIVTQLFGGSI
ncbi:MAG: putative membrane protein YedE/YeeE [Myxococcota bacterium]